MFERAGTAAAALIFPLLLHGQQTLLERAAVPFGVAHDASQLRSTMGLPQLRKFVDERIAKAAGQSAAYQFVTAELLKQLGDYRAADFYERAIAVDDGEPAYELFYADYLRNFRGPRRPLFAEAERHYVRALQKLQHRQSSLKAGVESERLTEYVEPVLDRIDRGLVALYQEDGVPLSWSGDGRPSLFLSTIDRFARSPSDLDEVHDTRDFTAEALFSASASRRNIALTDDDLRALVRLKEPRETAERLRFRHDTWPVLDVFYRWRAIGSAQVTDFHNPRAFNDVDVRTFGAALEKTIELASSDVYLRTALSHLNRIGAVETLPETAERIDQVELQAAAARFIGPDKLNLDARFTSQDIRPAIANPPGHDRRIAGATAEYQILRPLLFLRDPYGQLFETRGISAFGGFADDRERFDTVVVTRRDYFVGASLRGLGRIDVTLQPTWSNSRVSGDRSQDNSQFRTDATVLVRLLDEERVPGIPKSRFLGLSPAFVHLVFAYKRDVPDTGLDALENYRFGAALSTKLFQRSLSSAEVLNNGVPRMRPATILVSIRYEQQRFPRLGENLRLVGLSVSLGY
ncbi:MAG TPA: hypothetical protein VNN08_02330 [Thermoanaerobaculia bacterium]|nr:hypothetical protein [Thermoanaerobaculia bacterium]